MFPTWTDLAPFFFYGGLYHPVVFGVVLLFATVVDLFLGRRLLFGHLDGWPRAGEVIGLRAVLRVAIGLPAALLLKAPFLYVVGVRSFGLVSVAWYDLLIVGPWLAVCILRARRVGARVTPIAVAFAVLLLSFLPVAAYARFVEPRRLQIETVAVPTPSERRGPAPIRVAVLADIQTDEVTAWEREVIDRTLALEPDVILIPGDLFHGSPRAFEGVREALRAQLARLHAPGGVYFVQGDVDAPDFMDGLLRDTGVVYLQDEVARIEVQGRRVTVLGLDRKFRSTTSDVVAALEAEDGDDLRIVLCHYPRAVHLLAPDSRIDLVVAGHTHGGQIVVPRFGPPITLSRVPRHVAAGGLHELDGRRVYVSRGIGLERAQAPRIRFLCPPEISLLVFQ